MRISWPAARTGAAAVTVAAALLAAGCGTNSGPVPGPRATPSAPSSASLSRSALMPGRLGAVAFTGPRRGYGLFLRSAGSRCQDQVARTADGGAHFAALTAVISWNCDHDSPAVMLAADQAGDVFAYGPRLFVSHDSGATWAAASLGGGPGHDVVAVNAVGRSVWLVTARCGPSSTRPARCALTVLRSGDGGRSWTPATPRGAGFRTPMIGDSGQAWLLRTGRRSGYVLAPPDANPRGRPDRVPVWFTGDGGASWSRRSVPCGFDALSAAAAAGPGGLLYVACAGEPGAGNQLKSVARSADGGRTWSPHASCPGRPASCGPLASGYLGELATPGGQDVFLGGDRSALLVSRDGGAHWRYVRPPVGDGAGGTFAIIFFGRKQGLVLGDDPADSELPAIWRTHDGGAHWQIVHPVLS